MPIVDVTRCTGCGLCVEACSTGAMRIENNVAVLADYLCERHGDCVRVCPQRAIRWAEGEEPAHSLSVVDAKPVVRKVMMPTAVTTAVKRAWLPAVGTALVTLGRRLLPYSLERIGDYVENKLVNSHSATPRVASVDTTSKSGEVSSTRKTGSQRRHRGGRG